MSAFTSEDGSRAVTSLIAQGSVIDDRKRIGRPLCRRYVFVQLRKFDIALQDSAKVVSWQWGLGTFSAGELELLGAWPSPNDDFKQIVDDLAERGVERIQLVCVDDKVDQTTAPSGSMPADSDLASSSLQVGDLVSAMSIAMQFVGSKRRALLSAVAVAERLHDGLVLALNRGTPLANEEAAAMFVAQWLKRADRRLGDLASPLRRVGAPARGPMSIGATRAAAH